VIHAGRFAGPFGVALALSLAHAVHAQDFPVKPIRFLLGPAPDLLPRLVSHKLSEMWGQQVIIDQRPGAGGAIAAETAAKAAPDGYTWLMITGSYYVLDTLNPKLPYNTLRDFAPVTLMATIPFIAIVHPSVPAKSLADLVQLARSSPGKLNYASAGNGTTTHLAAELFKLSTKTDMVHVPFKGVAPAVNAVMGAQVQVMFSIAQGAVPHVQSGKVRALAITGRARAPAVPDVPTITESGFPEIDIVGWNGVGVPVKTPRALIGRLNADIRKVLGQKDMQERMIAAGFALADSTVEQFDAFVRNDVKLYERIVRASNIKLD
jgi:tripartite-type tricarboxylate transporter receptor subunit TctC